jgi:hypothetical protein
MIWRGSKGSLAEFLKKKNVGSIPDTVLVYRK